jgi:LMBR1-like membrane protein
VRPRTAPWLCTCCLDLCTTCHFTLACSTTGHAITHTTSHRRALPRQRACTRACRTLRKRIQSAVVWTLLSVLVFGVILALVYAINGYVEYDTNLLTSGLAPISKLDGLSSCVPAQGANATACSALAPGAVMQTWNQRPSFPIFVIAVASILGWLLLMVMGGVGIIALPLDMILACAPATPLATCPHCSVALPLDMVLTSAAAPLANCPRCSTREQELQQRRRAYCRSLAYDVDDRQLALIARYCVRMRAPAQVASARLLPLGVR